MRVISSYISPKAVKGRASDIAGRGLMAVAPIAADEIVAIKGGHIVDTATLRSLPQPLPEAEIQIAHGFHLAALEELQRRYGPYFSSYLLRRIQPSR
jgi:uncharacterized protein